MIAIVVEWKRQLDAIDGRIWHMLVAFLVGALVYAFKKLCPGTWNRLPSRFKAIPATIIGALLSTTAATGATQIVIDAVFGGLAGVTASGGAEFWIRLFFGQDSDKKDESDAHPP